MVKGIESVVVSECNVSIVVDEERQHIVPLFRDSIMERSVPLRILNTHINQNPIKCLVHYKVESRSPIKREKARHNFGHHYWRWQWSQLAQLSDKSTGWRVVVDMDFPQRPPALP